jgi:hypothetical protein
MVAKLKVKDISGRVFEIHQEASTVGELKQFVQESSGIDASLQRLVFSGKELGPDSGLLSDFGITNEGATIHVVIRRMVNPEDHQAGRSSMSARIRSVSSIDFGPVTESVSPIGRVLLFFVLVDFFRVIKWAVHGQWYLLPLIVMPLIAVWAIFKKQQRLVWFVCSFV